MKLRNAWLTLLALFVAIPAFGQPAPFVPAEAKPVGEQVAQVAPPRPFGKGLVLPADVKARHAKSWESHKHLLKALPVVAATSFDCRAMGWVPDFDDQGQCGDCHMFSGADTCASALIKAGYGAKLTISKQQILDCNYRDACDGGWPEDTVKIIRDKGCYTDADYGKKYNATPGSCKSVDTAKLLKISAYGFCSQADGVANYQDVKNAMVKFGVLSICYDASGTPQTGPNGPLWKGNGGRNVDHAIKMIAFDDSKSPKGAVLCWNQWFGDERDYFWAEWGANEIGTSALWASAAPLPPPPPPPVPPNPDPNPPVPPNPPTPGSGFTGSITTTYANGVIIDISTGTGGATEVRLQMELKGAGVSPNLITDIIKLITDMKNKAGAMVIMFDIAKIMGDFAAAHPDEANGWKPMPVGPKAKTVLPASDRMDAIDLETLKTITLARTPGGWTRY